MPAVAYPLRIPSELVQIAKLRARDEYTDQATALRQLLRLGAEEYVLSLLHDGRISTGKAAEILGETLYDIQRLAKRHGLELGATPEQEARAAQTAKQLTR